MMSPMNEDDEELFVTTTSDDGRTYRVTVRIKFDGIERIAPLKFRGCEWQDDEGNRDNGTIRGRPREDSQMTAQGYSQLELTLRHRRAISERRRFSGLRHLTQEVLAQIRYLNKVATSMRAGLLDVDEAASEIANTEERLHDMVGQLRMYAGVST